MREIEAASLPDRSGEPAKASLKKAETLILRALKAAGLIRR
jgi:hypothetical protein